MVTDFVLSFFEPSQRFTKGTSHWNVFPWPGAECGINSSEFWAALRGSALRSNLSANYLLEVNHAILFLFFLESRYSRGVNTTSTKACQTAPYGALTQAHKKSRRSEENRVFPSRPCCCLHETSVSSCGGFSPIKHKLPCPNFVQLVEEIPKKCSVGMYVEAFPLSPPDNPPFTLYLYFSPRYSVNLHIALHVSLGKRQKISVCSRFIATAADRRLQTPPTKC